MVVNGEYFWKYTDRDFDFDTVLNTPLAFPIQWQRSKIDGFGIKVSMPHDAWGYGIFSAGAHAVALLRSGGGRDPVQRSECLTTSSEPFRIDHDQAFQQTTHLQYQPKANGPWYGLTWRYESGLVAGNAPFASDTTTPVSLTYLTGDQQQQIQLACGGVRGTLSAPLTSCAPLSLSSPLVKIPAPGTENDDRNPPRVAPRTTFDMAAGWDDVMHGHFPSEKVKTNLSLTAVNVTDKYALYNFLSTFSGTHFVAPRTVTGQVTFNF